jgi:hypothetical protein
MRLLAATAITSAVFAATACSSRAAPPDDAGRRASTEQIGPPAEASGAAPSPATAEGAVVRFSTRETSVDVTIAADNAATRDFLSLLPLTLEFSDFAGREKVADLPRGLDRAGVPGSDPEDGDLISYIPWSNLGFYYDASGIGFDDQVIHLGTTSATLDRLEALEGGPVTIERIDEGDEEHLMRPRLSEEGAEGRTAGGARAKDYR